MMPLTARTPKPLLKVGGKALIDYVLDSLPIEIDEVIIVVKYLGNKIKKHVGKKNRGFKVKYVEGSEKGNAYSFLNAKKYLHNERFLVMYGDEMPNPNAVRFCLDSELSMLYYNTENGWIRDGVMVLNTDIFNYKPLATDDGEYYLNSMLDMFIPSREVTPVYSSNFTGGINTPLDLKRLNKIYG